MPNHFHILILANEGTVKNISRNRLEIQQLSENIRLLLSSYTKAINKQNNCCGSLFQQKTKAKEIDLYDEDQLKNIFHYIHQNPFKAGLVKKLEDWKFSSYRDYMNLRDGKLCNKELAGKFIPLETEQFDIDSNRIVDLKLDI